MSAQVDPGAIGEITESQRALVADVVDIYLREHGCPCAWPEFEYWVSKQHGAGWQDSLQNDLVAHACGLAVFRKSARDPARYGCEASYTCTACDRTWHHCLEERRMCAYREQLVPTVPRIAHDRFASRVGEGWFATAGQEPRDVQSLSLMEWAGFMLGRPCEAALPSMGTPPGTPRVSLAARIATWLRRKRAS